MEDNGWMNAADIDEELPFGGSEPKDPASDGAAEDDVIGKCPVCGEDVVDRDQAYFCSNYDCDFALWKNNRFFESISKEMTKEIATELLANGQAKLEKCKSVRTGNSFNCIVKMTTDEEERAQFSLEFPKRKKKSEEE